MIEPIQDRDDAFANMAHVASSELQPQLWTQYATAYRTIPKCCWVGGSERLEFGRQSEIMGQMWAGVNVPSRCVVEDAHNHFTELEALHQKDGAITLNPLRPN